MLDNVLGIATRQSLLALWQTHYVKDKLMAGHPGLMIELVPMVTHGDVILDAPLARVGGKGLFVKELEIALLEDRIDIAIHLMKGVPVEFPQGLGLVTICEREDPRSVFVSNNYDSLDALPAGGVAGTSSLRHQYQLAEHRPDLITHSLHDNVGTHPSKLDNGEYDAIILAVAGLECLDLESHIRAALSPEISLPAIRQGAVGTGYRLDDTRTRELFAALDHRETALRVTARRAMNTRLGGGCQVPIGGYAEFTDDEIWLCAMVGAPDGSQIIRGGRRSAPQNTEQMGVSLVEELLNNDTREILTEVCDGDAPA